MQVSNCCSISDTLLFPHGSALFSVLTHMAHVPESFWPVQLPSWLSVCPVPSASLKPCFLAWVSRWFSSLLLFGRFTVSLSGSVDSPTASWVGIPLNQYIRVAGISSLQTAFKKKKIPECIWCIFPCWIYFYYSGSCCSFLHQDLQLVLLDSVLGILEFVATLKC